MHRNTLKKGYILIYTFVIGLLCIFLIVSLLSLQYKIFNYNKAQLLSIEKVDLRNKYKENLFTLLRKVLSDNKIDMDEAKINNFLKSNLNGLSITFENGNLKYSSFNNMLILNYKFSSNKSINEYYLVKCENGHIKYEFVYKEFVGG